MVIADVEREVTLYTAPLATVGKPDTPWTKICGVADKVTSFTVKGDDIYLMTYAASPRFSIVRTSLAKPDLKSAVTVVKASEQVIFEVAAARDALYYESRDGAVKLLEAPALGRAGSERGPLPRLRRGEHRFRHARRRWRDRHPACLDARHRDLRGRRHRQGDQYRAAAPREIRRPGRPRHHRGQGEEPRRRPRCRCRSCTARA